MTSKKSSRGGLLALACGLLLAAFISFVFVNASLAQAPTPAPAAPAAAAAAEAAPPACDGTAKPPVLEKSTPNSGDTAWMLTSMALVLMMTVPGLGLFYGGMVRKKNVGDTVMTSFAITCLVTVLWVIVNYSTAFRAGTPFLGGFDRAFLQGILSDISKNIGNPNPLAPTIPETVYMCFQMTFAIITPALIAGAFAERMKFSAMLWFIGLWATLVYAPIAHWVWGPDGFLNSANSDAWVHVLDFAGGTVVHVNSGTAGLMACLVLGKRKDTGPGHNMVLTFIGASLLWVGSLAIGVAAGVVCYWGCTGLKHLFGYDDALDAFGVHAVGGAVGALLTGVFAIEQYGGTAGLIEGNVAQVINQIEGILIVFIYDAVASYIILKVLDLVMGLRVPVEIEREGLDLTLHGEVVQ